MAGGGVAGGTAAEVGVGVHKAGEEGCVAEVNDPGAGGDDRVGGDGFDAGSVDDEEAGSEDCVRLPIKKPGGFKGDDFGGTGEGEEEGEEEGAHGMSIAVIIRGRRRGLLLRVSGR